MGPPFRPSASTPPVSVFSPPPGIRRGVWDANTGAPLVTLAGHTEVLLDAAFSPDGTRVLTFALDNTARIWDLEGRELLTLSPEATMHPPLWSPDGRTIAAPFMDGTVRLWDSVPWNELAALGDDSDPLETRLRRWREARAARLEAGPSR